MQQTTYGVVDDWANFCQRLAHEILRQRDWRLVSEDDLPRFVRDVRQAVSDGTVRPRPGASPEATIKRATIHLYCRELYRASGDEGSRHQRRAFEEIGRHAQGVAFRYEQDPTIVQECAQRTVEIVWERREQVRHPGSFLRWIETIVYREIKGYWREKQRQREVPMSDLALSGDRGDNGESLQRFWEALATLSPPDDELMTRELREQLWLEVRRVLADNPNYEAVIVGYYLYELSLPTLAEMLQTPVRNVYVLKSRALARLRASEDFVRRFADALGTLTGGEA